LRKPGSRPWSKLQKQLYLLIDPELDFQIQCRIVRMQTERGSTNLPRYWITLNGDVIWDYPNQFVQPGGVVGRADGSFTRGYPHSTDVSLISELIREYIDTPAEELLTRAFEHDHWGLANILRAADRRVGRRQFSKLRSKTHNQAARKVLEARTA
jgi:hypothetical protein